MMLTPELRSTDEPCCWAGRLTATPMAKIANIAANTIKARRRAATILPNMNTCRLGSKQDRQHLEETGEPVRVLEGDRGVRVVERAYLVVPEQLLHWAICDAAGPRAMLVRLERGRRRVAGEGLDDALRDQDEPDDDRKRLLNNLILGNDKRT